MRPLTPTDPVQQARVISQIAALAALVESGQSPLAAMKRIAASSRAAARGRGEDGLLLLADRFEAALRAESLGLDGAALLSPDREFRPSRARPRRSGSRRSGGASEAVEQILRDVAACQRLSARYGVPLGRLLTYAVDCAHARQDSEEAVRTALAAPESTARLLVTLPFIGAGFGLLLLGGQWAEAVASAPGAAAVISAACLVLAGQAWTSRILARARRVEVSW